MRAHGLRATTPRLAVLSFLETHPHSSVDTILTCIKPDIPSLSAQSVYNVLADLHRAGMVRSLELPGEPGLYEINDGKNHHHAVCEHCHRIFDVPCALGQAPCLVPSHDHGMVIHVADVIYRGLCAQCAASSR